MKYISTAFGILGNPKKVYSKASTKMCYAKIVNLIVDSYILKNNVNQELNDEEILLLRIRLYNRLLRKGRLYSTKMRTKGLMAYYHPITGDIHIKSTLTNTITKSLVHESIHKIGPNLIVNKKYIGILEGATESIVTAIFSSANKLCKLEDLYFYLESSTYYPYQVLLVRQMDYMLKDINKNNPDKNITNMVENSVLNENIDFREKFIEQYGKKLFDRINDFCNKLLKNQKERDINKINDKFIKLQNEMLTICFDFKFYKILNAMDSTQDDYFNYLLELKTFEYLRAIREVDDYFEKYYIDKYMKIEKICIEENLGTEKIEKHRTMKAKFI